ncbi:MAG: hypothetical protein QOC62_2869 [Mycobacterium sp.]|nr:hypothetical protein [Mycobacterium sp.]
MDAPDTGLQRLNFFVAQRLAALRMTRGDLARRGGPNRSTLSKAISGARTMSTATLTRIDVALGWAPGSSAAILQGGTPTTRIARTASGDDCAADHAHVVTVLRTVESQLESCRNLLRELLIPGGGPHAG